jgi:PAS domain S-box-containing protein
VPVGVFRLQCENSGPLQLVYASPRCHEILGGDAGMLVASNDPPPVHPDDLATFMTAIHTAKSQQSEFLWAGRMVLADQMRWLQITATPSRSPDGVEQWAGIVQDITHRQEAEEALRRQRDLTQVVFDNAPLGILLAAPDLQSIIFANSAACTILGRTQEELVGKDLLAFIHPEDEDRVWQTLIQAVRPGHAPERITHRVVTPDGRTIDLEIIATGIADEHGHLINGLVLQRDITDERRMEQQLRQSEKMQAIGMLAGGIAHDFNNILACITGFADLARRRRRPDDPTLASYLDQIAGAADRAKTLVQQILSFSRRDAGQLLPVHLQSHVREVMDLLRASIPSSVEIQVDIDQDVGPVLADTGRIHQLLMNLCTNAVHAMAGHGRLVIALDQRELKRSLAGQLGDIRPGLYACLSINDSGCGMDATTLARIFEPFFTTKGSEGTGLGLAVVWNVISTHGGNIQVDSTPGQGTTFRIYLPVIAKTPVDEVAHGTSDLPHGTERLLVVDDEPVLRALYEDMLSDLGYQVRSCANGIEALSLLRQNPNGFDLMITDQTMPGMTGSELAKAALALRPDLPIVLCSGYSTDVPDEAAAKTLGVRHYCLKPVNLDMMAKTIRRILEPGGH